MGVRTWLRPALPAGFGGSAPVPGSAAGLLAAGVALACAWGAPSLYWLLLGAAVVAGISFLAFRHTVAFCVVWLLVTGLTLEMALNDLVGPASFQTTIAMVKGAGIALAAVCALRYGARFDVLNPSWGYVAMAAGGLVHGTYPGLTVADSFRSLAGSAAPYVFGFSRLSRDWAQAIIRTAIWCPVAAVAAGAVLAASGLRPLFVESGGARLAALGHPAFLAGVCLPAIYAGLIELWRDGRARDRVMLGVNFLVLILTGARAPLACALVVSGMTLLTVRSRMVPLRHRLFLVAGAGMLLPLLLLIAGDLAFVRLFNVLSNETGNLSGRELLWPAFQAVAEESPWFGWGLGAGNVIIPPEGQIAQVLHTWAAHNEYLRMQVEGGHIGRSLLIVLFILWARSNTAGLPAGDRRIMRLAFLAFAAHAYTDNVLISTPACVLFAFATAVFARGRHDRADRSALPGAGEVA